MLRIVKHYLSLYKDISYRKNTFVLFIDMTTNILKYLDWNLPLFAFLKDFVFSPFLKFMRWRQSYLDCRLISFNTFLFCRHSECVIITRSFLLLRHIRIWQNGCVNINSYFDSSYILIKVLHLGLHFQYHNISHLLSFCHSKDINWKIRCWFETCNLHARSACNVFNFNKGKWIMNLEQVIISSLVQMTGLFKGEIFPRKSEL